MRLPCQAAWALGLATLAMGSVSLRAQDSAEPTGRAPTVDPTLLNHVAVVQPLDGVLWGAGTNFKIRFGADGVEFFPMLGVAAPHNMPVQLALRGVGRGQKLTAPADQLPGAEPKVDGLRVDYARGWLTERYDVREDEVEQSFVFDRLPPGEGDLFVRLDLRTDLEPRGDGRTLDLDYGQLGSVRIGKVVGIDANGVRAEGAVRYEAGTLELSLPREFVDHAALPLVLDPVLGSNITIQSAYDAESPDIAYDRTFNLYLVVYTRVYPARTGTSGVSACRPAGRSWARPS